ncbi:MAG TPA: kelch repeat-containing protein [Chitinophagaceae bacterium]|nr:kelch repeat-containing protein [Chitinophagaceae bacterium]
MTELNCIGNKAGYKQDGIDEIEWSVAALLPSADGVEKQPGIAGPVTGIIDNRLIVAGGANFPGGMPWHGAKKVYHDEIYFFEKKNRQVVAATVSKQKLPHPVAYCANVMTPDGLVYIGGENERGISDKVVLVKSKSIPGELVFSDLPSLPLLLTNLAAAYYDHKIYAAGGNSNDGNSNKFFSLDISMPGANWQALPDIPVKISFAVMAIQSNGDHNCIYLMGGRRKNSNSMSDIFNTVYQFDIKENHWKQKQSLPYSVSAGTGIAKGSNYILLFGGDKGETFSKEEKLSAIIRTEKDEQKNKSLVKEKIALLEAHPGFTNEVLLYNTITDRWKQTNPLPSGSPVTTTAIKWDDDIVIPSGEIKAGVRTPNILMGKIK